MQTLKPLLQTVANAPLDEKFKTDIALLVTESLIRAVEIRTTPVPFVDGEDRKQREKRLESTHSRAVDEAMQQGFILTRYFNEQRGRFPGRLCTDAHQPESDHGTRGEARP